MLLMIDNYDSFTFNLVQYFGELGEDVRVVRNDEIDVAGIAALRPDGALSLMIVNKDPATTYRAMIDAFIEFERTEFERLREEATR